MTQQEFVQRLDQNWSDMTARHKEFTGELEKSMQLLSGPIEQTSKKLGDFAKEMGLNAQGVGARIGKLSDDVAAVLGLAKKADDRLEKALDRSDSTRGSPSRKRRRESSRPLESPRRWESSHPRKPSRRQESSRPRESPLARESSRQPRVSADLEQFFEQ